jgi:hypothetical protein
MLRVAVRALHVVAFSSLALACGRSALPDPNVTARAYARAAAEGRADRIYALLDADAQKSFGRDQVRELVRDERAELARQGASLQGPGTRVEAQATLLLADGSRVELTLEPDGFRVAAADTLPAAAQTPVEALDGLRRALARRSYTALLRVLGRETRGALETDLRTLAAALENPATLDVRVQGDRADVDVGGGHHVILQRESGTWRVEDLQ